MVRVIPVDDSGQILLEEYAKLLSDRTKLVAVTQVSNALGTVTPAERIVELSLRDLDSHDGEEEAGDEGLHGVPPSGATSAPASRRSWPTS